MISPRLMKTPMPARQVRVLLIGFLIRHIVGIAVFGWLVSVLFQLGDGPLWTSLVAVGAAALYAGVAIFNGIKIWKLYQRRIAAEQSGTGR
jgi:hypothetical protein